MKAKRPCSLWSIVRNRGRVVCVWPRGWMTDILGRGACTQISKRDIRVAAGTRQFNIRDSRFVWNSRIGYIRCEFACIVFYSCQFGFWLAEQLFRQNQKTRITMHSRPRIAHSLTLDLREIGILAPESFNSPYTSCENICVLNQSKRKKESNYL